MEKSRKIGKIRYIAGGEFLEVDVPELECHGVPEGLNAPLINLVGLLKVLVFLKEDSVVHDNLGGGDFQVKNAVVDRLGGFHSADALLQVSIEGPQLE